MAPHPEFIQEREGKMRRFLGFTLPVVAICMLVSNVALAQGQGGRRGGGGGGFGGGMGGGGVGFLIGSEQVQKELKLSEDQVAKVKAIQQEAFAGFAGGAGGGGRGANLSDEERQTRREEFAKRAEETNKKYLAVLDADQTTRIKQVQLWVSGAAGVGSNEEAAKELKLTDDQKAALKAINDEATKKRTEMFAGGGRGASEEERAKRTEQMASLRKDTEAECLAVLTDEQKSQFTKMRGPKFEFDMAAFGRGGPGGGRGRRGGNNNN
jgi:Spy/CpxP family protein refolding chaperone